MSVCIYDHDRVLEIVISKSFAIDISVVEENLYFDLYFCDLPLPKFTKRIGSCIQSVLLLLLDIPVISDDGTSV